MMDIRSAPMGLGAWGHGNRMFQPFVVTDYAIKALDARQEVRCPRNISKESRQQPPASMINVVSLFRFIWSVPPNDSFFVPTVVEILLTTDTRRSRESLRMLR